MSGHTCGSHYLCLVNAWEQKIPWVVDNTSLDSLTKLIEAEFGLAAAQERMQTLAAQKPGPYFIFGLESHAVLAIIDTTPARRVNEGAA